MSSAKARSQEAGSAAARPAPGEPALLEVADLHVWFDLRGGGELHAVRGLSLRLDRGMRLGLVGESGCGKTTAVLALMGLLPPSASVAGKVVLQGSDILAGGESTMRPRRWREIAMVFQGAMNAFNPVRTIAWQIAEPMRRQGGRQRREIRSRTLDLLEMVGIPASRADHYPHELSGGMRQRAAIAMALACEPKVLLADEPTTALDVMVQAQLLALLVSLTDELGLALVLVSHDLPVVAQMCHRVAVMYAGQTVEQAPTSALFADPRHPYSKALLAATPDILGERLPESIPGAPPRLDRALAGCAFAPRCRHAFERCRQEPPPLRGGKDRMSACHLSEALASEPKALARR